MRRLLHPRRRRQPLQVSERWLVVGCGMRKTWLAAIAQVVVGQRENWVV